MKNVFLCFLMLGSVLTFGQNLSLANVSGTLAPVAPNEIFRFRPGNVTQLDAGGFGFMASDRWFSLGKVVTGPNTAFGLRFQAGEKAVTFGYQSVTDKNPRIEWLGTGSNLGNLEFRSAGSFTGGISNLQATFTSDGRTFFGNGTPAAFPQVAKGSIFSDKNIGLSVQNPTGVSNIGVQGETTGNNSTNFQAAIYGTFDFGPGVTSNGTTGPWAGFFDGDVFAASTFIASDAKFKENVKKETNILSKIEALNPVSYNYIKSKDINLANGLQHGFIAQELEKVFPEMTTEVNKPIFNKEGNITSYLKF